jgi:hypothetical protein
MSVDNNMTCEEFYLLSEEDLKHSMEKFFNEDRISNSVINKLKDKLVSRELTIKMIYEITKENPWYNSLSKIVRADWKNNS